MGSKLIRDCCETKNSASSINISSDISRKFMQEDDEPVSVAPASFSKFLSNSKLRINFATNYIHLTSSIPVDLPVLLTFDCALPTERLGCDIVFIIELTSHVSKLWLDEIRKCLFYTLNELTENDRMSIVTYGSNIKKQCGLVKTNLAGKTKLDMIIKKLKGIGSAEIIDGIRLALKVLKNRIYINNIASVILFSASHDQNPCSVLDRAKLSMDEYRDLEFSFNSIGLGFTHDSGLLNFYSLTGNYYPIYDSKNLYSRFPEICKCALTGKIHNIYLTFSASSNLSVDFPRIFEHPKSVEFGKRLAVVFLISTKNENYDVNERIQVTVKISHKFECFECYGNIDAYGSKWIMEEIEIDEGVMIEYYKEKIIEVLYEMLDNDYNRAKIMLENAVGEIRNSWLQNSINLTALLSEVNQLQEEIYSENEWSDRIRTKIFAFIRKFWGKQFLS
ncbi:hypothetical protein SteCoe_5467 [Stentor coeruleus]|uniref:VWFA domain-containing protein n=1 Tax=Stentor coeruleus TaxID=5963 RepID=A0A1R2CSC7_9CILI|nr:hypothetical protein SteCoe_5467 [Stentor coeruleus]